MAGNDTTSNPLYEGGANLGRGIGSAIQNYIAYSHARATTNGQTLAMMQQLGQVSPQDIPPQMQKLIDKVNKGSAGYNDELTLLGMGQTMLGMKKTQLDQQTQTLQNQALQSQLALNAQQYQSGEINLEVAKTRAQAIQNAYRNATQNAPGGQPQGQGQSAAQPQSLHNTLRGSIQNALGLGFMNPQNQQGAPAPSPGAISQYSALGGQPGGQAQGQQPQGQQQGDITQQGIATPVSPEIMPIYNQAYQASLINNGFNPEDANTRAMAVAQTAADRMNAARQPIGVTATGFDGKTNEDIWTQVVGGRGGVKELGTATMRFPAGTKLNDPKNPSTIVGPVLDANNSFQPIGASIRAQANQDAGPPEGSLILGTPGQQSLINDGNSSLQTLQQQLADSNQVSIAAQAAAAKSPNGGAWNGFINSPGMLKYRQLAGNSTGQALDMASQKLMLPIIQSMKGTGQVRSSEIQILQAPLPDPTQSNVNMTDAADMYKQRTDFLSQRQAAYVGALKQGYQQGAASDMAFDQVPTPNFHMRSQTLAAAKVPPANVAYLMQNPGKAGSFDNTYGPGTSDVILNPNPTDPNLPSSLKSIIAPPPSAAPPAASTPDMSDEVGG